MARSGGKSVLAATLAACVMAVSACGDEEGSSTGGTGSKTFTIGVSSAQTGYCAPFDVPALKGAQVAVEEINAAGGIDGKYKVELVTKDSKSDPAAGVIATRELIDQGAQAMILACDADLAIATGGVLRENGVVGLSSSGSPATAASAPGYLFTVYSPSNAVAASAAQYALDEGYKNVWVIRSDDTDFTATLANYFADVFEARGGTVVANENVKMDQQDFSTLANAIKNSSTQPDVIFTSIYEPAIVPLMKQIRAAGVKTPVIGGGAIDSDTVVESGPAVDGLTYVVDGYREPGSDLDKFLKKIESKYGAEFVSSYAALGYDEVKLVEAAVIKAGSTDPEDVRKAMAELEDVKTPDGSITYKGVDYAGNVGAPRKPQWIIRMEDGKRVPAKPEPVIITDSSDVPKPTAK